VQIEGLQMFFKYKSKGVKKKNKKRKKRIVIFNFNVFEEKTSDFFKFQIPYLPHPLIKLNNFYPIGSVNRKNINVLEALKGCNYANRN